MGECEKKRESEREREVGGATKSRRVVDFFSDDVYLLFL